MKRIERISNQLKVAAIKKILSKDSPLAIARSQYKLYNVTANKNATEFMQKYESYISSDQKLDPNKPLHQEVALTFYKYREGVKFFGQEVTRKIYPEVMKIIDQRQVELYGSITKNPYIDPDAAVKSRAILDKLADKGMSIGELKDATFKSGGKDVVNESINEFASIFAEVISTDIDNNDPLPDIFKEIFRDIEIKEKFIEEPEALGDCFYDPSEIKSDIKGELTSAYSEKLQNDILTEENKNIIDTIIESIHNKEFQDSIKNIDDINPDTLDKVDENVVKNSKDPILGRMKNEGMSTLKTHDASDPIIKNALASILNKLEPYTQSTSRKFSSDSIESFNQEHSGEIQQKVASIDDTIKSTQQEIETKQKALEYLKNDITIPEIDKQKRIQDLDKEIRDKIQEIEKAQEHRDILDPSPEERKEREEKQKEIEDKTWRDHEVKFKDAIFDFLKEETVNIAKSIQQEIKPLYEEFKETEEKTQEDHNVKSKILDVLSSISIVKKDVIAENKKILEGNFVEQIENYLLNKVQGTKETEISNNIDVAYRSYDLKGSKVETLIVEEMTGDVTILQTDNQQLFVDILGAIDTNI